MLFHAALLSLAALSAAAPVRRAATPAVAKVTPMGYATDPSFNPWLYRDGGGGGCLNGVCVIGFSDSFTTSGNGKPTMMTGITTNVAAVGTEKQTSFAHNSFATFHPSAGGKPTELVDFGTRNGQQSTLNAAPLGPVTPAEQAQSGFAVWPNGNMVAPPGGVSPTQLVGVANALTMANGGTTLYNTMYTVDLASAASSSGPAIKRIVPALFNAGESLYGTFCLTAGHGDGFLYLWAVDTSGALGPSHLKLARVPAAQLTDKSKYTYWSGSAWVPTAPGASDTTSAVFTSGDKLDTGEVFWSDRFNAWTMVTSNFGEFRVSTAPSLTGPWSAPTTIYKAQVPPEHSGDPMKILYAGHSYPGWDASGDSLLLSWTVDEDWTQMAVVEWA